MSKETTTQIEKKTNAEKIIAFLLLGFAIVLVLCAVGFWIFLQSSSTIHGDMFEVEETPHVVSPVADKEPAETEPVEISADWIDSKGNHWNYRKDTVSFLLMGVDYMGKEKGNAGNADALVLAIYDPKDNSFKGLFIPRDTMTEITQTDAEGNYLDRIVTNISTAHSYGDGGEISCGLEIEAVSNLLFGVPIQRYAALSYDSIKDIGNILDGIDITLDADYTELDRSYEKGATVHLKGNQLVKFISWRSSNIVESAYSRGTRHMLVLKAMYRQCIEQVKEDPAKVITLYNAFSKYLTTDFSLEEIVFMAHKATELNRDNLEIVTLQGTTIQGEKYEEFHPDKEWLEQFVAENLCEPAV